tara:strand:+ start:457 stop:813 length:357 start_codon:yes stop_codon:yes gene_type:complete
VCAEKERIAQEELQNRIRERLKREAAEEERRMVAKRLVELKRQQEAAEKEARISEERAAAEQEKSLKDDERKRERMVRQSELNINNFFAGRVKDTTTPDKRNRDDRCKLDRQLFKRIK